MPVGKVCIKCKQTKNITEFRIRRKSIGEYFNTCYECELKANRRRYLEIKLSKFNLTSEERNRLIEKGCQICGSFENLHMDHNHKTGEFRGILCKDCNTGLGFFRDKINLLLEAAAYLDERKKQNASV